MLLQRQGGTFYDVTVRRHSSKMASSGMHDMTYKATISDTTGLTFGKPGAMTLSQMFGFGSLTGITNQFLK